MNNRSSNEIPEELQQLIDAAIDGTLDESGMQELETRLRANETATRAYLLASHLHSDLRLVALEQRTLAATLDMIDDQIAVQEAVQENDNDSPETAPRVHSQSSKIVNFFTQRTPLSLTVAGVAISLLLAIMAWMVVPSNAPPIAHQEDDKTKLAPHYVAQLTNIHKAVWAEGQTNTHRGANLLTGQSVELVEGTIKLTYFDGVAVTLQGPCEYIVEDTGSGTLNLGKLVATVPEKAIGFQVITSAATITDLSTQFGVTVSENDNVSVQVSKGRVSVEQMLGEMPKVVELAAGQSLRFDGQWFAEATPADEKKQLLAMLETDKFRRIGGVSIHDVSSELAKRFHRPATRLVDGSGLLGAAHSNNPGQMWETNSTIAEPHDPLPAHVTFDLGAGYELSGIHVWNYNESGLFSFGARQVEISVSPTDNPADLVKLPSTSGSVVFPQADGKPTYRGFELSLKDAINSGALGQVRMVRFTILSNHDVANELTGLSEVQFWGRKLEEPLTP